MHVVVYFVGSIFFVASFWRAGTSVCVLIWEQDYFEHIWVYSR